MRGGDEERATQYLGEDDDYSAGRDVGVGKNGLGRGVGLLDPKTGSCGDQDLVAYPHCGGAGGGPGGYQAGPDGEEDTSGDHEGGVVSEAGDSDAGDQGKEDDAEDEGEDADAGF